MIVFQVNKKSEKLDDVGRIFSEDFCASTNRPTSTRLNGQVITVDRKELFKDIKRIVLKIGTSSLSNSEGIADQIFQLIKLGKTVAIVSSGAVEIGTRELGLSQRPKELSLRQAAAAAGQHILMEKWSTAFNKYGIKVAEILLAYKYFSNLRKSVSVLLERGIIPIINKNDAASMTELETIKIFLDNDRLSAMVASEIEAELLIILSDIDGLYDKNPKKNEDAKLIPTVEKITPKIENIAGKAGTKGVGGMKTKIEAAKIASMSGCHMIIANSAIDNVIIKIINGEDIGTLFLTQNGMYRKKNINSSNGLLMPII